MEFSLGRETLPSQARSVRGESRRLRRERDNAKKLLYRYLGRRIAQRDRAVAKMRPVFNATGEPPPTLSLFMIACQGTTQAENRTGTYRYRPRARAHARRGMYRGTCRGECRDDKRAIAAVSLRLPSAPLSACPPFAPSPLAPQPDGLVRIISMAVRAHASLVAHSNHNLAGTTVIKPSQR